MKNIVLICYMFVIHSISSAQIAYFTTTDLLKTSQFIVEGKVVKVTPRTPYLCSIKGGNIVSKLIKKI